MSETDEECLEAMSKQELIELVQSLRSELTNAQETIEYLNDTIDDIHEREMNELCEEWEGDYYYDKSNGETAYSTF